jgi:hypothetical protein
VKPDYATLDLVDGLNIAEVNDMIQRLSSSLGLVWTSRSYYLVTFRSNMKLEYDQNRLFELDKHSHEEAIQSGGLLKYWFGTVNEHRRNLAFCRHLGLLQGTSNFSRYLEKQTGRQRWRSWTMACPGPQGDVQFLQED